MMKCLLLRLLGHSLVIAPVVFETLSVLPYHESSGILDKLRLTGAAAVVIAVVVFTLLRNVMKERIKAPAPWMLACGSFLTVAACQVIADKLFYITLAWALGSLASLIPYALAKKIEENN